MMDTHTLRDYDGESETTVSVAIQKGNDFVSVKEPANGDEYREVLIEQTGGVICIRAYAADSDAPVMIKLAPDGGVKIELGDYDTSKMEVIA